MTAKAIVWDGSFGDVTLPRVSLGFAPPLHNTIYDWAADDLPMGLLGTWPSIASGVNLTADSGAPQVVTSSGGKAVRFDGEADRMRLAFSLTGARTIVAVYRFTSVVPSAAVTYGYLNTVGGAITTDTASTLVGATIGTQYLTPSPRAVPDTSWHVALLSVNGDNSAFRHDRSEGTGEAPVGVMDGITLGFSARAGNRAPIEYKRVSILSGGTTGAQRDAIVNQMASRYGISI